MPVNFDHPSKIRGPGHTAMIDLNQKLGFCIVKEIDDFWGPPEEPAVVLELKL